MSRGWRRFVIVAAACGAVSYLVFGLIWEQILAMLRWIEALSDVPGLSGVFLLAVAAVLLVVLSATADWVRAGFRQIPERTNP